jgi:peptide/nickel transport system substrate-binding protein
MTGWISRRRWLSALLLLPFLFGTAEGATFTWSAPSDVSSLDPYGDADIVALAFDANIYEPLVRRDRTMKPEPGLATAWRRIAPDTWRFSLRQGVRFQDGAPFSADDVLYSYNRAKNAAGARTSLAGITAVREVDESTVDIVSARPAPLLPADLTSWLIMSARWTPHHDPRKETDGTGPFKLSERHPGQRTVLLRNSFWWERADHNLDRAVFLPIPDAAKRVAALKSGQVDLITPVPTDDVARLTRTPGIQIVSTPGLRTLFLGFDQVRPQLADSSVAGRNPFKDLRVRKAIALAIDAEAIARDTMHGFARPAGLLIGPGVTGFDAGLDRRPPFDPAVARTLLHEAGYGKGFAVTLDCPEGRYLNDADTCRAVSGMLAGIGIQVTLRLTPSDKYLAKIGAPGYATSFYLMGWTPSSDDALGALAPLAATRNPGADRGQFNIGGFSYPALDRLIDAIESQAEPKQRQILINQALTFIKNGNLYVPLQQQSILWAARDRVQVAALPDGSLPLRFVTVGPASPAKLPASASGGQ